jgi:hypothetical protein
MTAHEKQNHSLTQNSLETEAVVEYPSSYAGNIITPNLLSNFQLYCI